MDIMSFSKAISIFGLKNNYTEDELKKRYRELVRQNHPDYHMNDTEEKQSEYNRKTQDINEAYDILKKNSNIHSTYTYESASTYWSHQNYQGYGYRRERYDPNIIIQRSNAVKNIRSYNKPCDAEKLRRQVSDLITKYIILINKSQDVNMTLINFKIDLEQLYRNYIKIYCQKHKIPSFLINQQKFNYDCDCAKLFNQLKDCERTVGIDISKIIRKYQYHEHFKILEDQILEERNKVREKISYVTLKDEYLNLLREYSNKINELIIEYNKRYRDFKFALDKLSHQLDSKVKKYLYDNIKEIVLKSNDDELTELLKSAIEESRPKKETKKENKESELKETFEKEKDANESQSSKIPKIREIIYAELRRKYLANSNSNDIDMVNKLFMKAVELLYSENCTIVTIGEIKKITFKNPKEEYERLIKLSTKANQPFDEFLCINRAAYELDSKICKARKIMHGETIHYVIKNISFEDEFIDEKTFKEKYITIDEFLQEAIFLGYKQETYPFDEVLYYNPKYEMTLMRLIAIGEETGYTYVIGDTSPKTYSYKRNKKTDIYQYKAYLKEDISKFFDREYEEWKEINKGSSYKR